MLFNLVDMSVVYVELPVLALVQWQRPVWRKTSVLNDNAWPWGRNISPREQTSLTKSRQIPQLVHVEQAK